MKRLNHNTGKPYQIGDKRSDGKVFFRYIPAMVKRNGYFQEYWVNSKKLKTGIKRKNPITGKLFKRGDTRNLDNKIFSAYKNTIKDKNGYVYEEWRKPESFKRLLNQGKEYKKKSRLQFVSGKIKKRINPKTGKHFISGNTRKDGFIFTNYDFASRTKGGFTGETWISSDKFHIQRIKKTLVGVKERCIEKKIKLNLDVDYLLEIFPNDNLCPILKTKMNWGESNTSKRYSPSLDRFSPDLGYIKGNVRWISNICNTLKSDRNYHIIRKIYLDMKNIMKKKNR